MDCFTSFLPGAVADVSKGPLAWIVSLVFLWTQLFFNLLTLALASGLWHYSGTFEAEAAGTDLSKGQLAWIASPPFFGVRVHQFEPIRGF